MLNGVSKDVNYPEIRQILDNAMARIIISEF